MCVLKDVLTACFCADENFTQREILHEAERTNCRCRSLRVWDPVSDGEKFSVIQGKEKKIDTLVSRSVDFVVETCGNFLFFFLISVK